MVFLGLLVAVFVALAIWGALDVRSARDDLITARSELTESSADLGTATDQAAADRLRAITGDAVRRTERAENRLERAPILKLAGVIPGVSTQRDGLLRAVRVAHDAARTGDELTAAMAGLRGALTVQNATVDLDAVAQLADAAERAGRALHALPRTHRSSQWGPLEDATRELDEALSDTSHRLTTGADTIRVARTLLGGDGPRRVFIGIQNNAEMRDQGMVLSYALAESANGSLRITKSGSVDDIPLSAPVTDVALPVGTTTMFGALQPLQLWQSVNATADTALTGQTMRSMYHKATGVTVDGTIALDIPALASLLSLTGPVTVAGIAQPISSDNAAKVLLHDLYGLVADDRNGRELRQKLLADVTTAVIGRLESGPINATALVRVLGNAAAGGHVSVTSANPDDQARLDRAGLSGAVGRVVPRRTVHIAVQNGTANKLDWFVDPTVDMDVTVTPDGTAVINATVTVPNTAPVPTPSSEQFGPDNIVTNVAGLYRARVYFWGPSGGDQLNSVEESKLRLSYDAAEVPAGATKTVSFSTAIPNAVSDGMLRLRLVPQARVRPMKLHVSVTGLGWRVRNAPDIPEDWSRPLDLSWKLSETHS